MIWTNRANLPPHLASVLIAAWERSQAVYLKDRPEGSRVISVTQLIAPPQKLRLEREHAEELTMDVLDTVPSLRGSSLHHILELAGKDAPELVPEERLSTEFEGWTITGKKDLYETKEHRLIDFKDSSVWAYIYGKPDWDSQLNVLRWIEVRNGGFVASLEVDLFVGDWRKGEKSHNDEYPERVVVIPVPMWTLDETERYVSERLAAHGAAQAPPCSPEERWEKPTRYAVKKHGQKKALKLFDVQQDADLFAAATSGGYVEKRPGISARCESYCMARPFCRQAAADPTLQPNAQEMP